MSIAERLAYMYANQGVEIAVVGMTVVFLALAVISIIIAILPHFMKLIDKVIPEAQAPGKVVRKSTSGEAVAIAIALAHHQNSGK